MFQSSGVLLADRVRHSSQQGTFTVLFADLRDSTALSEQLSTESMVDLLNEFLGALARPIIENGGIVDKFLGDGVMAVFGLGHETCGGAVPAARSALAMRHAVQSLNDVRRARHEPPVRFGVGICTGDVIIARIGLPERSDFTAIGITVNTAARLSGLCKTFGVDVIVSDETSSQLRDEFSVRTLGTATVQGRTEPLLVATLD